MALPLPKNKELMAKFGRGEGDSGSPAVQIAILTERINSLTDHLQTHVKDFGSRRGLLKLIGKRKRLQAYFQRRNPEAYAQFIRELGLRR